MIMDDYERNNLYWLLVNCQGTAADTGDWLMQIIYSLEAEGVDLCDANANCGLKIESAGNTLTRTQRTR